LVALTVEVNIPNSNQLDSLWLTKKLFDEVCEPFKTKNLSTYHW